MICEFSIENYFNILINFDSVEFKLIGMYLQSPTLLVTIEYIAIEFIFNFVF